MRLIFIQKHAMWRDVMDPKWRDKSGWTSLNTLLIIYHTQMEWGINQQIDNIKYDWE